jgi:hypothetical protein
MGANGAMGPAFARHIATGFVGIGEYGIGEFHGQSLNADSRLWYGLIALRLNHINGACFVKYIIGILCLHHRRNLGGGDKYFSLRYLFDKACVF